MSDQHTLPVFVLDELDRTQSAELFKAVFPANLKRWGSARTPICRARNGSKDNPVYRLRSYIRRGRRVGMTREQAMLLVADLMGVIEQEFGAPISFEQAAVAEQIPDSQEDQNQMRALVDRSHLPEFIRDSKASIAASLVMIACAERELARQERRLA